MPAPRPINVETITDEERFRELEGEWTALLQSSTCDCLFLTWEWAHTWWLHLAAGRKLHIITVRCGGELVALAPLVLRAGTISRLMPWRALEFLASGSVGSDHMDFIIRPGFEKIAMREFAASLSRSDYMLELTRTDNSSKPLAALAMQLQQSGWDTSSLVTNYAPYSELAGHNWQSFLGSLHGSHRKNVTRLQRRLHENFELKLQLAKTEAERARGMNDLVRMHLRRWADKGGSKAFHLQELVDFHEAFSRISLAKGWLRLYTLMLDDQPVASLYVFKYRNVFYQYQAAFDLAYSKYSVGTVILALVIKEALEEGADEFDYLHDNEPYKYRWASQERELVRLELYPFRKHFNVYRYSNAIKQLARHFLPKSSSRQTEAHDQFT